MADNKGESTGSSAAELTASGDAASSVKAAIHLYYAAIEADPTYVPALEALANVLARKARWQDLVTVCDEAAERGITTPGLVAARSTAVASQFDLDSPDGFLAAVKAVPRNERVRSRMGPFVATQYKRDQVRSEETRLRDEKRVREAEEAFLRPLPTMIRIETASSCNLRCQHCTTGVAYESTDRRVMSMDTFELVIRQLQDLPTIKKAAMYLGGEPFLNRNHALMCRRIKAETGITTTKFVTNATLLTDRICADIAASSVDSISISIDGRSPEENDVIRERGRYETIRSNILMLRRHLDAAGAKTVLQIGNTQLLRPGDPVQPVVPEFLRRDFPGFEIGSGYAMVWPGMTVIQSGLGNVSLNQKTPRGFCDHPFYDVAVRANGDITLCCYDISGIEVMGNVHTSTIAEVYESPKYLELRRAILHRRVDLLPAVCQRCRNYSGNRLLQDSIELDTA